MVFLLASYSFKNMPSASIQTLSGAHYVFPSVIGRYKTTVYVEGHTIHAIVPKLKMIPYH